MPKAGHIDTTPTSPMLPTTQADTPRASRRYLFVSLGRAALASVLTTAASLDAVCIGHPDAELLSILGRFGDLEQIIWPVGGTGCRTIQDEEDRARRLAPLKAEQATLVSRACVLRATTLDGLRARAQALLLWDTELPKADTPEACLDDRMLHALIRDLVGGAVA